MGENKKSKDCEVWMNSKSEGKRKKKERVYGLDED